jgi:hypothetical protein
MVSKPKTCLGLKRKSIEYEVEDINFSKADIEEEDGFPNFEKYVKIQPIRRYDMVFNVK